MGWEKMQVIKPGGRDASVKKYDLLSALMAHGLAGDKHRQRTVMRLIALITTRYNWQRDELSVGQPEIARLWSVDERTVKREMARLRGLGWLVLKRAGVRGRVSLYGLGLERLHLDTRPQWALIGPDFIERMGGTMRSEQDSKVVPLHRAESPDGKLELWNSMRRRLEAEDPSIYAAWYAGLSDESFEAGCLTLVAPNSFHAAYVNTHLIDRLLVAARRDDPAAFRVKVVAL